MNTERSFPNPLDCADGTVAGPTVPPRRRRRPIRAVVAAVVVAAAGAAWAARPSQHPDAAAAMVAPAGVLDLSGVSPALSAEYHYAADHADAYRQMRCWCGCEKAFGHRNLLDCFVRAGGGWEAHGAGCAGCITEAMSAHRRLDAGDTPAAIARDLDTDFGPPPTSPTGA